MSTKAGPQDYPLSLTDNLQVLGNYYFNLYLVKGAEASALVEMGVSAVVDTVIDQLDELDIAPDYLVVTHPHTDHITGLAGLRERFPQARIIAGKGARDFVLHPKAAATMTAEDRFMSDQLRKKGIEPGRPPVESIAFPEGHIMVGQEMIFDLGGLTLKCIPIKGHSPGNIVVHVPEIDTLVLSDALGFHYPGRGFCPLYFTGFKEFLATLDDLADLKPQIVGPGHQGPITGQAVEMAFAEARKATLAIRDRIMADTRDPRAIANDLFDQYYKDEFTLYSEANIRNCMQLLVRRAHEAGT